MERVGGHFARSESRRRAQAYLIGLLSPVECKNGWQLAEVTGEASPYDIQQFLYRSPWEADAVRDELRTYAVEHLGDRDGVLIVDGTGFVKKGVHSAGVQRQSAAQRGRSRTASLASSWPRPRRRVMR